MHVSLSRFGFHLMWRVKDGRYTRGFIIKTQSQKLFSERYGYTPGLNLGPLFIRGVRKAHTV